MAHVLSLHKNTALLFGLTTHPLISTPLAATLGEAGRAKAGVPTVGSSAAGSSCILQPAGLTWQHGTVC